MATTTISDLWHLFFQLQYEIDDGKYAPISEAQDAIVDGEVIDFIEKYADVDLSLYSDSELDALDDTIQSWGNYDKKRTGAYNNGLAMVQSNLIMVVQGGVCADPDTGTTVDVADLEIH